MLSSGSAGSYQGPWLATQGGGGTFSVGGGGSNKSGAIVNLSTPSIAADSQWHCLEWLVVRETTPGVSADGVFKAWIDGTLVCHWANLNFNAASGDPTGFDTVYFGPFYGGGGSAAPADEYLCVGRFLCAGAT
jgi:hypothetical protein